MPANLPEDYTWTIFSEDRVIEYSNSEIFTSSKDHKFSLVIGTNNYINETHEEFQSHPKQFALAQNFPNPFNPITNIKFSLPKEAFVSLKLYDVLGREVKTLLNGRKKEGVHQVVLNGNRLRLASGLYIYKLKAGKFVETKKMLLLK